MKKNTPRIQSFSAATIFFSLLMGCSERPAEPTQAAEIHRSKPPEAKVQTAKSISTSSLANTPGPVQLSKADPEINGASLESTAALWASENSGKLLSKASNEQAVEWAIVFSETAAYLASTNELQCMQFILPSKFGPLTKENWPSQFLGRQMDIQRKIAVTALSNPSAVPLEADAGPILDMVIATLEGKYGKDFSELLSINESSTDLKHRCEAWSDLYGELSKLPPNQGGLVIRWLNAP